jgi:subtilisin family serine protease
MKKVIFITTLAFLLFVSLSLDAMQPQRGERPEIDITQIPDEAILEGTIQLKFKPEYTNDLDENSYRYDADGIAVFGLDVLDQLNKRYRVHAVDQMFDSPALDNKFEQRHRSWGFHLWYQLYLDSDEDIRQIVLAYRDTGLFEVVEPEYKKRLIGSDINDLDAEGIVGQIMPRDWVPDDPMFDDQWHYLNTGQQNGTPGADIDLIEAWDIERGSSAVIVAIIDDGIQYTHPDLADNMWDDIGYNFVNSSNNVIPGNHGTHVAGTVAAVSNNGIGVAGVAGGSGAGDGVRLMSCQVFYGNDSGGFHLAPVYAADNDASISQNSWGYTSPGSVNQNVLDAIDYFNQNGGGDALDNGITIFAAGNDNSSGMWYPGYYSGAFSVAATNNNDVKAWYSNYDTWIDISAPGGETNVVTQRGVLSTVTSSNYTYYQGTSMACPHTSGVAALMISLAYGQLSADDVADILIQTTDDHYDNNPGFIGMLGSGRLNANNALNITLDYIDGVLNPRSFDANATSQSEIELTWTQNDDNNEVLVAWTADGEFGELEEGVVYNAGQSIPGGGMVLYRGDDIQYTHQYLNASTTYYYRAWSYNEANEYSFGRPTQTTTHIVPLIPPIEQNFEAPLTMGWEIVDNQGNGQTWEIGTMSNGLAATTGDYAYINSNSHGMFNSQNSDIISPVLDFSAFSEVNLSFDHFYEHRSGWFSSSTARLYYSTNGGESWTQLQSWNASTSNPAVFDQSIPALVGQTNVRFRWNYEATWGYHWCIDNIVIDGVSAGEPQIDVFPASLSLYADIDSYTSELLSISNDGEAPLVYSVSVEYEGDRSRIDRNSYREDEWLFVSPNEGIVYGDEEVDILVSVDTSQLEIGVYSATLIIENNAGDAIEVPVMLYLLDLALPPQNVQTEVTDINNVEISWEYLQEYSREEGGYRIYRNNESIAEISDLNITEYLDEGLDEGSYEYYLTIFVGEGESEASDASTTEVILLPPTDLTAQTDGTSIICSWEAPVDGVNITAYIVYRDGEFLAETENMEFTDTNVSSGTYSYTVTAIYNEYYESGLSDEAVIDHVSADETEIPLQTEMRRVYPNPFNVEVTFSYALSAESKVQIEIFDITGRKVQTIEDSKPGGSHTLIWNGMDRNNKVVASGIYLYRFSAGGISSTGRILLLK